MRTLQAVNAQTGRVVAERVELADGVWSRFRGLMLRRPLEPGCGLLLRPSSSIHTFFMRFPIDVVYLDRAGKVVKVVADMKPWRVSAGGRGARQVLELPSGSAAQAGLQLGDEIEFRAPA